MNTTPPAVPVVERPPALNNNESLGLPIRNRDTAVLLILTILADICMYRSFGGAGGAALLLAVMLGLLILKSKQASDPRILKISGVIVALAATLIWSAWWLAVWVALIMIFRLAVNLWQPKWKLLESFLASVNSIFLAPLRLYGHLVAHRTKSKNLKQKSFPTRVILIPLAVSSVFLIIFSAANPILASKFAALWEHIVDFLSRLGEYLNMSRFLFWCGWLLVFAVLIRPVLNSELIVRFLGLTETLKPCEVTPQGEINFLSATATLLCVNVVFLGYNGMDAVYLYFKATLPAGINWTAYTHAGCGWLTFGLFLSSVVLGFIFWKELNFHKKTKLLKQLAYIWIAQNAVLAIGTLRRIYMYIDYSGLTHLLLTGVYGSLLVMSGLVIMTLKIRNNRSAIWLLRNYVVALATGLTVLALTPHGYLCAIYNVPRVQQAKVHASWPIVLKNLPADALPPIIPLLDYSRDDGNPAKEKLMREGIAAILGQHLVRLEKEESQPWGRNQISSFWALKHLREVREKIFSTIPEHQWDAARERLVAERMKGDGL